ncbi:MAG: NUDIX hydrolase [Candidatus Levybacteria bacterium]|nr:NUDIX hydrolase [Candidatus Levybacteria bacterium]
MVERNINISYPKSQVVDSVAVIVIEDDQLLVVNHGYNTTLGIGVRGVPGGHREDGETLEEAAVKELLEETGLETLLEHLVPFKGNFCRQVMGFNGQSMDMTMTAFICTKYSGQLRPEPNGDTIPEWTTLYAFHYLHETGPNQPQIVFNAQQALASGEVRV